MAAGAHAGRIQLVGLHANTAEATIPASDPPPYRCLASFVTRW